MLAGSAADSHSSGSRKGGGNDYFPRRRLATEVTIELSGGPLGGEFRRLPRHQDCYDGTIVQVMSGGQALSQITAVYWRRADYAGPEPIPFDYRRTLTTLRRSRA